MGTSWDLDFQTNVTDSQGRGDTGFSEESGSGWAWGGRGWGGDTRSFEEHDEMEEHGRTGGEDRAGGQVLAASLFCPVPGKSSASLSIPHISEVTLSSLEKI